MDENTKQRRVPLSKKLRKLITDENDIANRTRIVKLSTTDEIPGLIEDGAKRRKELRKQKK